MNEINLYNTDETISTNADNSQAVKFKDVYDFYVETNISSHFPNALRANTKQKEISVRITTKNKTSKNSDINTF